VTDEAAAAKAASTDLVRELEEAIASGDLTRLHQFRMVALDLLCTLERTGALADAPKSKAG